MKRVFLVLLLLAALAASAAYFFRTRNAPPRSESSASPTKSDEIASVTVATARRRPIRRSITLVGSIKSDKQASLSVRMPSTILSVSVRAGDRVRAGQSLIQFDARDTFLLIEGAGAGLAAAEAQYRKALDGKRAKSVELDSQIAQAKGGLATALAKQRQAELGAVLSAASAESDSERAAAAVRQAEAGLRQAETGLAQAEDTLKRLKPLYAKGGIPRVDLEGAQVQMEIAKAQRDSAIAALDQAKAAAKPAGSTLPLRKQVSDADVEAARAGVAQAEDGLRAARQGKAEALRIADRDIEAARAQVDQARIGRSQATNQMTSGVLTSPIAGIVTDVQAHAGEIAQPGMPLVTIISPEKLYLEAAGPARYSSQIKPGQPARIVADTLPGRTIDGQVTRMLSASTIDSRTIPIQISLSAEARLFSPGSIARATIDLARDENAVSIPVDALRNEGSVNFVYVVVNGVAQRRNPSFGPVDGPFIEVLAGVQSGEQVIVAGPATLQSGTAIKTSGR